MYKYKMFYFSVDGYVQSIFMCNIYRQNNHSKVSDFVFLIKYTVIVQTLDTNIEIKSI